MQIPECIRRAREGRAFHSPGRRRNRGCHHDTGWRLHHCPHCAHFVHMDRHRVILAGNHPASPVLCSHHVGQVAIPACETGSIHLINVG